MLANMYDFGGGVGQYRCYVDGQREPAYFFRGFYRNRTVERVREAGTGTDAEKVGLDAIESSVKTVKCCPA